MLRKLKFNRAAKTNAEKAIMLCVDANRNLTVIFFGTVSQY
jgi:hypothetical protein